MPTIKFNRNSFYITATDIQHLYNQKIVFTELAMCCQTAFRTKTKDKRRCSETFLCRKGASDDTPFLRFESRINDVNINYLISICLATVFASSFLCTSIFRIPLVYSALIAESSAESGRAKERTKEL